MAMLADRKRKQKWVILDRNVNKDNNWSKDSNKFGKKMLERMGWQEGKGLGRNEDGLTDYVKVAYKNNSKGMGFKDSVEWSAQQDNFNTLLGELSSSKDDSKDKQKEIKSLEQKSQNSRARVHYKKFTRGKDLSRYSEKDLANILGKKKLGKASEEDPRDVQEETSNNNGLFTISGSSMVDYFKNKMKFKSNEDSNGSGDESVSYGLGFNSNVGKKNKKSKQKDNFVSYVNENDDNVILKKRKGDLDEVEDTPSKKKLKFEASPNEISKIKKKSKKKLKNDDQGLSNPAFEPLGSNIPLKKHCLDTIIEDDIESKLNESENGNKKKKSNDESSIEEPKPKKKKKKAELNSFAIDNPNFHDEGVPEALAGQGEKQKRKKKSKGLDNPALNTSSDSQLGTNENSDLNLTNTTQNFEVKRKKKKKSKGLDNPALNMDESIPEEIENNPESVPNYEVKRKKKKSKDLNNPTSSFNESQENKNQNGIANAALEISDCDIMLNTTVEPVKTTPTPKINKNKPRNKFKNVRFSKTNEEFVIPTRSPGDIDKRNELYDINTKVIQDGLRNLNKKQKGSSSTNQNFDIKSVDKIDFSGIDNHGFDVRAQNVEESVNSLTKTIDSYQAEVENGINESKMKKTMEEEGVMVGEFNNVDGENEILEDGVVLRFKYANFNNKQPLWAKNNNVSATFAKKSYKHLIRGDVVLAFKNSNLHKIDGYAATKPTK